MTTSPNDTISGQPPLPGLYIHVPFCASKCPYCDFYSIAGAGTDVADAWLSAVRRELTLYRDRFSSFATLYLGGGTPSLLTEKQLATLVESVRQTAATADDAECTIEVNPNDLTPAKAGLLRELGFNRISIGIQSFDDAVLRFLQRRHSAREALQALEHARTAGFQNISLDLMYALPGQDWPAELARTAALQPEHLACYQLTIKPGTRFHQLQKQGGLRTEDDEKLSEIFLRTSSVLAASGYGHYEVSNFAREPRFESFHNSRYWQHIPYLGIGPAAHSFDGRRRWWNRASVADYCDALGAGELPIAGSESLSRKQLRLEALMLRLRTSRGIALSDIALNDHGRAKLERLQRERLVTIRDGQVAPTLRGMLLADSLPLFIE